MVIIFLSIYRLLRTTSADPGWYALLVNLSVAFTRDFIAVIAWVILSYWQSKSFGNICVTNGTEFRWSSPQSKIWRRVHLPRIRSRCSEALRWWLFRQMSSRDIALLFAIFIWYSFIIVISLNLDYFVQIWIYKITWSEWFWQIYKPRSVISDIVCS